MSDEEGPEATQLRRPTGSMDLNASREERASRGDDGHGKPRRNLVYLGCCCWYRPGGGDVEENGEGTTSRHAGVFAGRSSRPIRSFSIFVHVLTWLFLALFTVPALYGMVIKLMDVAEVLQPLYLLVPIGLLFFCFFHSLLYLGLSTTVLHCSWILLSTWLVEVLGTNTGFPFGSYYYQKELSEGFVVGVPSAVAFSWYILFYLSGWLADQLSSLHFSFALGQTQQGGDFQSSLHASHHSFQSGGDEEGAGRGSVGHYVARTVCPHPTYATLRRLIVVHSGAISPSPVNVAFMLVVMPSVLVGLLVACWELVIEPMSSSQGGLWVWGTEDDPAVSSRFFFGAPLLPLISWFVVGFLIQMVWVLLEMGLHVMMSKMSDQNQRSAFVQTVLFASYSPLVPGSLLETLHSGLGLVAWTVFGAVFVVVSRPSSMGLVSFIVLFAPLIVFWFSSFHRWILFRSSFSPSENTFSAADHSISSDFGYSTFGGTPPPPLTKFPSHSSS